MTERSSRRTFLALGFAALLVATSPLSGQATGSLVVKADPGRAGVFLDGRYLGPAANMKVAQKYSVPAGQHEVILREPRYQEYKTTVNVDAGKTTTISQVLQAVPLPSPPFGKLKTVGFAKYSAVYINGGYVGHTDEFNGPRQVMLLKPGDYDVKVTAQAGTTLLERKVSIKQDVTETLKPQ